MIQVYPVRPDKRDVIPAVTHVDGSGRLQTVSRETNPRYWSLIRAFGRKTGVPVLLNTSFNENEPIVLTPDEALDCFLRTDMDVLVMGSHVLEKLAAPGGSRSRGNACVSLPLPAACCPLTMHVCFFNRSYWPDIGATGQLLTELAEDLVRVHGWDVTVVTGYPLRSDAQAPCVRVAQRRPHRSRRRIDARPEGVHRPRHQLPHLLRLRRRSRGWRSASPTSSSR